MDTDRLGLVTGSGVAVDDVAPDGRDCVLSSDGAPIVGRETGSLVVIGRHGPDRDRPAHRVDHAANLAALQSLGCGRVLAVASTGSLRRDWRVGTVVLPDDFFGPWVTPSRYEDTRGHTVPGFDVDWRAQVREAWRAACSTPIVDGGVYVQTTGPRFETPAEIRFFATVGDVVGMTVASECVIAREMGLAYAAVCVVDNIANGLDDVALTVDEFEVGVMGNRRQLITDIRSVVDRLCGGEP